MAQANPMHNAKPESRLLKLAIVLLSLGHLTLVGCGSRDSGRAIFTIENATDQQIEKVTIPGFDPMSPLTVGPIGEGETRVIAPTARFAIELPKSCKIRIGFADGTTSEVDIAVGNNISRKFTGKLAFKIRASDSVELLVSPD